MHIVALCGTRHAVLCIVTASRSSSIRVEFIVRAGRGASRCLRRDASAIDFDGEFAD